VQVIALIEMFFETHPSYLCIAPEIECIILNVMGMKYFNVQ
jgi:hypothetical protein